VLVTHDPEVASRADRRIVLKDGQIVEDTLPCPTLESGPDVADDEETPVHG